MYQEIQSRLCVKGHAEGTTNGFRTHGIEFSPLVTIAMMGVPWRGRTRGLHVLKTPRIVRKLYGGFQPLTEQYLWHSHNRT